MGIIKQGILGGFSGKVANVVGTSWKGRAVIKSLPISVANPRTTPQVNQRSKFTEVVQFASFILASMIIPLMNRFAGNISGYNRFVSLNIDLFNNTGLITPASLSFGSGRLGATQVDVTGASNGGNTLEVGWNADLENQFQADTDVLYLLVRRASDSEILFQGTTGVARVDNTAIVNLNETIATGNNLQVWGVFLRADGTEVGNTSYDLAVVPV